MIRYSLLIYVFFFESWAERIKKNSFTDLYFENIEVICKIKEKKWSLKRY
jgi:hypothetical protein